MNPSGNARIPPGSARIRRTSAKNIFPRTPSNVRRTFGGLRTETDESTRSPPRTGGRVHSKNVRRQKLILRHRSWRNIFRTERPSAADDSAADVSAADDSAADVSAAETSADTIRYLYYCKNFRRDVVLIYNSNVILISNMQLQISSIQI